MDEVTFKLGELFSGPGGIAYGAKLASLHDSKSNINYSIKHMWTT